MLCYVKAVAADRSLFMRYMSHRDAANASLWAERYRGSVGLPVCQLAKRGLEWARGGGKRTPLPAMDRCVPAAKAWAFSEPLEGDHAGAPPPLDHPPAPTARF